MENKKSNTGLSIGVVIAIIAAVIIGVMVGNKNAQAPVTDNSNPVVDEGEAQPNESNDNETELREIMRTGEASDLVEVDSPSANSTQSSPIEIFGMAPGDWFFEATAPVDVVNWDGLIIGQGFIQADGEWMTEDQVPFSGTVEYELSADTYSTNGWLILRKQNASGLPENDAAVEIPIILEVNA